MKLIGLLIIFYDRCINAVKRMFLTKLFKQHGKNVKISKNSFFSYSNITVGDDVYIGPNAMFLSSIAKIIIGNKVMFGPNVTIITGDHRYDRQDVCMYDISDAEKKEENDQDVIIEDDVWVGAGVIILKGVRIGKGSVIGAGSVVVKEVPPFSIFVGSPPIRTWPRFEDCNDALKMAQLARLMPEPSQTKTAACISGPDGAIPFCSTEFKKR